MNNQLTLCGHVGQEPRAISFGDTGNKVVKFSLAVKEFSNGAESTLWIDVDAWNGLGERILSTVTKGRELVVSGRLAVSKFSKQDENGKTVEVHKPILKLTSFHLCGPKPASAPKGETAGVAETAATVSSETKKARVRKTG